MSWQAKKMHELINKKGSIDSLGIWDAFSAKIAEQEGPRSTA